MHVLEEVDLIDYSGVLDKHHVSLRRRKSICEEMDSKLKCHSHLAQALEELWGWGVLTSPVVQAIAEAAVADGLQNERMIRLSQIGSAGKLPGNTRRDLMRASVAQHQRFPKSMVSLPVQSKRDKYVNKVWVLPIHDLTLSMQCFCHT